MYTYVENSTLGISGSRSRIGSEYTMHAMPKGHMNYATKVTVNGSNQPLEEQFFPLDLCSNSFSNPNDSIHHDSFGLFGVSTI